jgi:hypothetical protein
LVLRDDDGHLVGVLPAAADLADRETVVSHPGATYGGIVHGRRLRAGRVVQALEAAVEAYRSHGFRRFVYKLMPSIFHTVPSEDDRYALFRVGAERSRCDLSAAVDLAHRGPVSVRRSRLVELEKLGIGIRRDLDDLDAYWRMLTQNLADRHTRTPVHTVSEMRELMNRFPADIVLVTAQLDGELLAGTVLFKTRRVTHTQYLASSQRGRSLRALDYVLEDCISAAANEKMTYVSFGISTNQDCLVLNDGLQRFKMKFGAGSIVHETYTVRL